MKYTSLLWLLISFTFEFIENRETLHRANVLEDKILLFINTVYNTDNNREYLKQLAGILLSRNFCFCDFKRNMLNLIKSNSLCIPPLNFISMSFSLCLFLWIFTCNVYVILIIFIAPGRILNILFKIKYFSYALVQTNFLPFA